MRLNFALLFMTLFVMGTATACSPSEEGMESTIHAVVIAAVKSTLEMKPAQSPYPSYTALATTTDYPQPTFEASATRYPTSTAYPTATPYPSFTPRPTLTPSQTPSPSPTHNLLPAPQAPVPTQNLELSLDEILLAYRRDLLLAGNIIRVAQESNTLDCPQIAVIYSSFSNFPTLDLSDYPSEEQNAYAVYRDTFNELVSTNTGFYDLTQYCREQIQANPGQVMFPSPGEFVLIHAIGLVQKADTKFHNVLRLLGLA